MQRGWSLFQEWQHGRFCRAKGNRKYFTGLETRLGKTAADAEFRKLLKSLIYAVEEDAAEIRAKEQLEVITNE
jgi:hypothetical protein